MSLMESAQWTPICESCNARPKKDRSAICEECWQAPRHTQACIDSAFMFHAATGEDADCICGASEAGP